MGGHLCLISFKEEFLEKPSIKKCLYLHTCVLVYVKDKLSYHRSLLLGAIVLIGMKYEL